jgi:hypothetical protein
MSLIKSFLKAFLITLAVILGLMFLAALAMPTPEELNTTMNEIETSVAEDFEAQYWDVVRHGSEIDRCLAAQMVATGYLQANTTAQYAKWREVQTQDCEAAGVPF